MKSKDLVWRQMHVDTVHPNIPELMRKLLQQFSYGSEGNWFCFGNKTFVAVYQCG